MASANAASMLQIWQLCALFVIAVQVPAVWSQFSSYVETTNITINENYINQLRNQRCQSSMNDASYIECINRNYYINPGPPCRCLVLPGFNRTGRSATMINYCDATISCHENETQTNVIGGCKCTCPTCYTAAESFNSICVLNTSCCGENGFWNNESSTCVCNSGFTLIDGSCVDNDECLDGINNCSPNATCNNQRGSYSCVCNEDFDDVSLVEDGPGRKCRPAMFSSSSSTVPNVICVRDDDATWNAASQKCQAITVNGVSYRDIQASANGFVAFNEYAFAFTHLMFPGFALFATEFDTTNFGSVCTSLHYLGSNQSIDESYINRVNRIVQYHYNDSAFSADVMLVYSLNNASYFGSSVNNVTGQLIIAANVNSTYAISIYPKNGINWPEQYDVYAGLFAGFNNHSVRAYISGSSDTSLLYRDKTSGPNITQLVAGLWIQQIPSLVSPRPVEPKCCLATQNIVAVKVPNACPFTLANAAADYQFILDTDTSTDTRKCYLDYFWYNQTVYSSAEGQNITVGVKQRCCYTVSNGALATKLPDAGIAVTNQAEEANMVALCPASNLVPYRPISTFASRGCYEYNGFAYGAGDVHYVTFDGCRFDFMGSRFTQKEAIIMRSVSGVSPNFRLQCLAPIYIPITRVSVLKECALQFNGGSVFKIVALNPFAAAQTYAVFKDGSLITQDQALLRDANLYQMNFPDWRILTSAHAITVVLPGSPIINFYTNSYGISLDVYLANSWIGKVEGLLGNFNLDARDDFRDRNNNLVYSCTSPVAACSVFQTVRCFAPNNYDEADEAAATWLVLPEEAMFSSALIRRTFGLNKVASLSTLERAKRSADVFVPNNCSWCANVSIETPFSTWNCNSASFNLMNQTCYGAISYEDCMLDLAVTCSLQDVQNNMQSLANGLSAQDQARSPPVQFNMPSIINVTMNSLFYITLNMTGNASSISIQPSASAVGGGNASAGLPQLIGQNLLVWNVTSLQPTSFLVTATDYRGRTTSWEPEIYFCGCSNNGQCSFAYLESNTVVSTNNVYMAQCNCPPAYDGNQCQLTICQSDNSPCDPTVTCAIAPNGLGAVCGPCASNMLTLGGRCVADSNAGSLSPCYNANCSHGCLANYISMTATCTCAAGYQLTADNSTTCIDVNECLNASACQSSMANCTNFPGGYNCLCPAGFTSTSTGNCVDANECVFNPCQTQLTNLSCTNTLGSYTCACRNGYTPVSGSNSCAPIDYCAGNPCSQDCNPLPGSYFCSCNTGFVLSNATECVVDDTDYCAEQTFCPIQNCSWIDGFILCSASVSNTNTLTNTNQSTQTSSAIGTTINNVSTSTTSSTTGTSTNTTNVSTSTTGKSTTDASTNAATASQKQQSGQSSNNNYNGDSFQKSDKTGGASAVFGSFSFVVCLLLLFITITYQTSF